MFNYGNSFPKNIYFAHKKASPCGGGFLVVYPQ